MKNHRLTISCILLGIVMIAMTTFVVISRAASPAATRNPYDSSDLGLEDVVKLYHKNMNAAFNSYISKMMRNIDKNPNDPNGKAFHIKPDGTTGTAFTAAECLDPKNDDNYSTYCASVNLLGADSDLCQTEQTTDDMIQFCKLDRNSFAMRGYLNFSSAMSKRTQQVFDTAKEKEKWSTPAGNTLDSLENIGATSLDSITAVRNIFSRQTIVNDEMNYAKAAMDQTLSAYDQLRVAWPMHVKYKQVYKNLETYRDKLVDLRHQTDLYPKKFIDLTTTACQ